MAGYGRYGRKLNNSIIKHCFIKNKRVDVFNTRHRQVRCTHRRGKKLGLNISMVVLDIVVPTIPYLYTF